MTWTEPLLERDSRMNLLILESLMSKRPKGVARVKGPEGGDEVAYP